MNLDLVTAKTVVKLAVGFSVGNVTTAIVKNNAPAMNNLQTAQVFIASHVLGQMVADTAVDYATEKFDAVVSWFDKKKQESK